MPYFLVSCLSVSVNQFSCKQCMAIMAVRAARAVLVVLALDTGGEQEDRGPSAVNGASVEDNISLGLCCV